MSHPHQRHATHMPFAPHAQHAPGYQQPYTGFDPTWLTYPTIIGPPTLAYKKIYKPYIAPLFGDDKDKTSSHGRDHGGSDHGDDKASSFDWATFAWVGLGIIGAGVLVYAVSKGRTS